VISIWVWAPTAAVVSAALSLLFSHVMRKHHVGKRIRKQGPRAHLLKEGTPTMGGVVILAVWGGCLAIASCLGLCESSWWMIYAASALYGAIGLLDDLLSQRALDRDGAGLRPWQKIALGTAAWALLVGIFPDLLRTAYAVPFAPTVVRLPGWLPFPLTWFVFTGATNSMNLTDGLDGLAAGVAVISMTGLVIALPDSASAPVSIALVGTLTGFLWTNSYPSKLFMGDVGSFALGAAVAALTIDNGLIFFLPFFAAVPLLEAISVIVQVALFRTAGVRLFRMSPLHHHFEETTSPQRTFLLPTATWTEPKITMRFWIVHALVVAVGVLAVRF